MSGGIFGKHNAVSRFGLHFQIVLIKHTPKACKKIQEFNPKIFSHSHWIDACGEKWPAKRSHIFFQIQNNPLGGQDTEGAEEPTWRVGRGPGDMPFSTAKRECFSDLTTRRWLRSILLPIIATYGIRSLPPGAQRGRSIGNPEERVGASEIFFKNH